MSTMGGHSKRSAAWRARFGAADSDYRLPGAKIGDMDSASISGPGDLNGDSVDDFIVGAWRVTYREVDAGATYLYFGGGL